MTSILSGLETAKQALSAQQFALSITQRNVANAGNEAYTRQDAVFTDVTGSGGSPVNIQALRDRYIDFSIQRELQSLGKQETMSSALQQIDAIFNENNNQGLQKALSDFFNSFSALSTNPEDSTLRRQVLSKATALTTEFNRLYAGLRQVQTSADSSVASATDEINTIAAQIAALNKQMPAASGSAEEFSLRDQRQKLLENLSGFIDISYYESEMGSLTVSTGQGGLLVIGKDSFELTTAPLAGSEFLGVQLSGSDITSTLQSGKLSGWIEARETIAGYLSVLDDMAATLATRVNDQHTAGVDPEGDPGEDIFSFTTAGVGLTAGAARTISVALSEPRKIAAAKPAGGTGNNENAKLLNGIKDEKLFSSLTETTSQFYAGLIYRIGSDEQDADNGLNTQISVLKQLKNQRDSSSGVNMDEEAINLIKYQRAYQASAEYATVLNSLSDEILNILGV